MVQMDARFWPRWERRNKYKYKATVTTVALYLYFIVWHVELT